MKILAPPALHWSMALRDLARVWELAVSVVDRDREDQTALLELARKMQRANPAGRYVQETHDTWNSNPFR